MAPGSKYSGHGAELPTSEAPGRLSSGSGAMHFLDTTLQQHDLALVGLSIVSPLSGKILGSGILYPRELLTGKTTVHKKTLRSIKNGSEGALEDLLARIIAERMFTTVWNIIHNVLALPVF